MMVVLNINFKLHGKFLFALILNIIANNIIYSHLLRSLPDDYMTSATTWPMTVISLL
jgi:hypothetical protein